MSEAKDPNKPRFDKGDRAAIVGGNKPVGTRGEVFWVGENKYGPGWRFGMKGDDGRTYWLNEEEIGSEDGAPPAPPPPERPELEKGTRVKVVAGKDAGAEGEIFWVGQSKYGPGLRYGVKEGEDTYWADEAEVEVVEAPVETSGGPEGPDAPPPAGPRPVDDAVPDDGDLPPEAFEHNLTEDDIPF